MKIHAKDGAALVHNTLQHALGPFLILSQFFGVFPVHGVGPTSNVAQLDFHWWSPLTLLTIFFIGYAFLNVLLFGKVIIERGLKMYTADTFSFTLTCLVSYCVFLELSRHWPKLMKSIHQVEAIFLQDSYQSPESKNVTRRIHKCGILFLIGGVLEHMTSVGSAIYSNHLHIKDCNLTVNFIENYYMRESFQLFSIIRYRAWLIPFLEWITISMTFVWSFVDIFLMLVCASLAGRFKQLLWKIELHQHERMPSEFWANMRTDLLALTDLLHQMDQRLSNLILLSCSHNLYFICIQVFNGFLPQANFMKAVYFWCSFLFVLIRILTTLFTAASINDTAGDISVAVYEIPTAFWCLELKRFHEIIASEMIALSGRQFFFVTRRLIFAMAGTIVVYELVLFEQVKEVSDNTTQYCALIRTF